MSFYRKYAKNFIIVNGKHPEVELELELELL